MELNSRHLHTIGPAPSPLLRLLVGLLIVSVFSGPSFAQSAGEPPGLESSLTDARSRLEEQGAAIDESIAERAAEIEAIEKQLEGQDDAELRARRDRLVGERDALATRLGFLEEAARARQEAVDSDRDRIGSAEALADLQSAIEQGAASFVEADIEAARTEIAQAQSAMEALATSVEQAAARLKVVEEALAAEDVESAELLESERRALQGTLAALDRKKAASEARIAFLRARVDAAREALGLEEQAEDETQTAPEVDENELRLKELLAERLSQQARDDLEEAQTRLEELRAQRDANASAGNGELKKWTTEIEYWQRKLEFAKRTRQLAELRTQSAAEEQKVLMLVARVAQVREEHDLIVKTEAPLLFADSSSRAADLRAKAGEVREAAEQLQGRETEEREKVSLHEQLLAALDAQEAAIEEHAVDTTYDFEHLVRMSDLLRAERNQVRQLSLEQKVLVYALGEQAWLQEELATIYEASADRLNPPFSQWIDDHMSQIRAVAMLLAALVATWIFSALGRLLVLVVSAVAGRIAPRLSVQRFRTLTGFFQSIIKVFLWVGVIIAVLQEFGIEPAKSTGAIGLIGLILAGMFQQIVLDFVKGIDIIVGRHYHVGDFVEVGGEYGYVLDFNAKYTRIRTPSGQQINIPNSKCVPSRRFPDGFVDNYVDLRLENGKDTPKAKAALQGICREINERVEVVKEEPSYVDSFLGADGEGRVIRYLVRVLPGSDWVVKNYFVPRVKTALEKAGIVVESEPSVVFMNGVERFRKLFSRELTEAEIQEEVADRPLEPVAESPPAKTPDS